MYKKIKKPKERAYNKILISICDDLHKYNNNVLFATSKTFIEESDKSLGAEIKASSVITSSVPVNELNIPSTIKMDEAGNITMWNDSKRLIKVVCKEFHFVDGSINEKTIKNLYLQIDGERQPNKNI